MQGGTAMQCETATVRDVAPLTELVNSAFRGTAGRHGWTHEADLIAGERVRAVDLAAMIDTRSTTILLRRGERAGELLACIAVESLGERCAIGMLAVAPELQTGGLGSELLAEAERFAAGRGAKVARISVLEQRPKLIAWYERRGYERTGAHEAFPDGENVGVPVRDDLRFVVLEKAL